MLRKQQGSTRTDTAPSAHSFTVSKHFILVCLEVDPEPIPVTLGMKGTPWMVHQSITGHHVYTHSQFSVLNPVACDLGGGRKPENLEEINIDKRVT